MLKFFAIPEEFLDVKTGRGEYTHERIGTNHSNMRTDPIQNLQEFKCDTNKSSVGRALITPDNESAATPAAA